MCRRGEFGLCCLRFLFSVEVKGVIGMIAFLIALLAIGQVVVTVEPQIVSPNQWSYLDVYRAPSCMRIDGVIGEKEWAFAAVGSGFTECFQAGYKPVHATYVRALWDDGCLYVAFEFEDNDIWGTYTKRDDPIYVEEAAEMFIDPDWTGRHYWEVNVSPRNTVADLMVIAAGWQGRASISNKYNVLGLHTGVKVYGTVDDRTDVDRGWTAEYAIPWTEFKGRATNSPPRDGDSWRVNFFRIDRLGPGVEDDQFLAWSLSPGVFHQPKNFGVLVFRDCPAGPRSDRCAGSPVPHASLRCAAPGDRMP